MPSLKQLRRRIRTVKNTQQITGAMRSVAASKMRRTQDQRTRTKPYAQALQKIVANVIQSVGVSGQPFLESKEPVKRLVVVIASDRGLCGAFNNTILRHAEDYVKSLSGDYALYCIGKRSRDYFRKRNYPIYQSQVDFRGNIEFERIAEVAEEIKTAFLEKGYSHVELVYNHALTSMTYKPKQEQFLPLQEDELVSSLGSEEQKSASADYIFEPDAPSLLSTLLPKFVATKILYVFVDAFAAEHQARMLAMKTANDNCSELIDQLTLEMNRARQASITTELLEIVGGAEALKG